MRVHHYISITLLSFVSISLQTMEVQPQTNILIYCLQTPEIRLLDHIDEPGILALSQVNKTLHSIAIQRRITLCKELQTCGSIQLIPMQSIILPDVKQVVKIVKLHINIADAIIPRGKGYIIAPATYYYKNISYGISGTGKTFIKCEFTDKISPTSMTNLQYQNPNEYGTIKNIQVNENHTAFKVLYFDDEKYADDWMKAQREAQYIGHKKICLSTLYDRTTIIKDDTDIQALIPVPEYHLQIQSK